MNNIINKVFLLILIGFYIFLGIYFKPWTDVIGSNKHIGDLLLGVSSLAALIGLIIGSIGLIMNKNTRILCLVSNGIYLIIGCFAAYIYWSFWIFHEPAFKEKLIRTIPAFILGVFVPFLLFYYFFKVNKK